MENNLTVRGSLPGKIFALLKGDLRNVGRDLILLGACCAPVLIALAFRFIVPVLTSLLKLYLGFDLIPHYPLIVSIAILLSPMMFGTVIGFLIVDERDENILVYYSVTPLSRAGYLAYRLSLPMILGFLSVFLITFGSGLTHDNVFILLPSAIVASMEAPLFVLILGAFASNKVEALTLAKALGILDMIPIAGYLAPAPWHLLLGVFPPYWVSKAYMAGNYMDFTGLFAFTAGGLAVHAAFILLMLRRFVRRIS